MIDIARLSSPALAEHWWVPLLRGIVSILFGVVLFAYPLSAVGVFVLLFGAYALIDGILTIVQALRSAHPRSGRWWFHLVAGSAGILAGVLTFALPGITAFTLGVLIAVWAIVPGILEIGAGFRLRGDVPGEIFLILAGAFSVVLGVLLFMVPLVALLAWVWVIGAYAVVAGIAFVILAFRLRSGPPRSYGDATGI